MGDIEATAPGEVLSQRSVRHVPGSATYIDTDATPRELVPPDTALPDTTPSETPDSAPSKTPTSSGEWLKLREML